MNARVTKFGLQLSLLSDCFGLIHTHSAFHAEICQDRLQTVDLSRLGWTISKHVLPVLDKCGNRMEKKKSTHHCFLTPQASTIALDPLLAPRHTSDRLNSRTLYFFMISSLLDCPRGQNVGLSWHGKWHTGGSFGFLVRS